MPIVEAEDKTRPFVPSCPSNGAESMKEGGMAKNPQDPHYGDGKDMKVFVRPSETIKGTHTVSKKIEIRPGTKK